MLLDAPLLKELNFFAIEFAPMDFELYHFDHGDPGEQALFKLPNDLHISVVRHKLSYGGDRGLYEVMVLNTSTGEGREIPGITDSDGIVGNLEPRDVTDMLIKLAGTNA